MDSLPVEFDSHAPELPVFRVPLGCDVLEFIVRSTREYLDRAGIEHAVLVGNSLGGHVAARLALSDPERVAGLVLTGSSGLFERGLERHVPRRPDRAWLREKISDVFYDPAHVTESMIDEVAAVVGNRQSVLQLVRVAQSAKRDNLAPLLPRMACPTLLVWGADDRITPLETAHDFQRLLPDSELRIISRCGHAPMLEQPDDFNKALADFIQALRKPELLVNALP